MTPPTSAYAYDIKLKADLNSEKGLFLPLDGNPGRSRVWAQSVVGSNIWKDTPIDPNIRGNGPHLKFNTTPSTQSDRFQVTVYFINALPTDFASIAISTIFTPYRHGNATPPPRNVTPVASPFLNANGNVQSIITATWSGTDTSTIQFHPDTGTGEHAIVFSPGNFNFNPNVISIGGGYNFEFTVVAQFTTKGGVTKEYAYDPEMEIEITSSGVKPIPVGKKAGAVGA